MSDIDRLIESIVKYRNARDWKQFHNPKDVAISLSLEASEVLEHFQWQSKAEIKKCIVKNKKYIGEELADVLYWVLLFSHDLKIDIAKALGQKLSQNEKKYPVSKSKGSHKKYTRL